MYYDPPEPDDDYEAFYDEDRFWTRRRVVMLIVTVIILLSLFVAYYLPGIMTGIQRANNPLPTPTSRPRAEIPVEEQLFIVIETRQSPHPFVPSPTGGEGKSANDMQSDSPFLPWWQKGLEIEGDQSQLFIVI